MGKENGYPCIFDPETECQDDCNLARVAERYWEKNVSTIPPIMHNHENINTPQDYEARQTIRIIELLERLDRIELDEDFDLLLEECLEHQSLPPLED